jgi:hypothetical protein
VGVATIPGKEENDHCCYSWASMNGKNIHRQSTSRTQSRNAVARAGYGGGATMPKALKCPRNAVARESLV